MKNPEKHIKNHSEMNFSVSDGRAMPMYLYCSSLPVGIIPLRPFAIYGARTLFIIFMALLNFLAKNARFLPAILG